MNTNRSTRSAASSFLRCTVIGTALVLSIAVGTAAQDEVTPDPLATAFEPSDTERSLEPATRKVIGEARQQLEMALRSTDSSTRFGALRAARRLDEPWIAEVVLPLCKSANLTERNIALEAVTILDPEAGREAFLTALEHPQRSVRLRGLLGLERLADPETIADVIEVLETDDDPDLRVVAARTLGTIGDVGASTALRHAIESPNAPLREQAVLALLAISREDVGRYLLRFVENDAPPGTVETLKLIALVPDPTLIELLEPFLVHADYRVRTQVSVTILTILERSTPGSP